ncbi:hypothetical protein ACJIZ3_006690 [Penstemon smallii]|uniref:Uncharacterized protein n=1 Tax=Penstemon smallii TaxID=265156 RepID=A0ABD3S8E4_9LAMI
MKNFYRKGTVHPTPPVVSDHLLSFLPAAILTLTVALSPEDKEVLAYLISCFSANFSNNQQKATQKIPAAAADHPPCFSCNCFRCYMSYWVKWDSSPNRQLIHEIIEAFEDTLVNDNKNRNKKEKNKKEKKKKNKKGKNVNEKISVDLNESKISLDVSKDFEWSLVKEDLSLGESTSTAVVGGEEAEEEEVNVDEEELEKGSVRRFVNFLGERFWSVWG